MALVKCKLFPLVLLFVVPSLGQSISDTLRYPDSSSIKEEDIPVTFDARKQWPKCADLIGKARDQGKCKRASWAFSTASVLSDRLCIRSDGKIKIEYSPQHLLDCVDSNFHCDKYSYQTNILMSAWKYIKYEGVVTGADLRAGGCKPYQANTWKGKHHGTCTKTCDHYYDGKFAEEVRHSASPFRVYGDYEMQAEIILRGPVQTKFSLYQDFYNYSDGVYYHLEGGYIVEHYVKVIGWGIEQEVFPYWLVVNSWGTKWGKMGGLFKILRVLNECGFGSHGSVVSAVPLFKGSEIEDFGITTRKYEDTSDDYQDDDHFLFHLTSERDFNAGGYGDSSLKTDALSLKALVGMIVLCFIL